MIQGKLEHSEQENAQNDGKTALKMAMGDTFRVRRYNELNWILELWVKGGKTPGTGEIAPDHWIVYGYYGQLADVARHLINQKVLFTDGTSGKQVMDAIRQAENSITEALEAALQNAL